MTCVEQVYQHAKWLIEEIANEARAPSDKANYMSIHRDKQKQKERIRTFLSTLMRRLTFKLHCLSINYIVLKTKSEISWVPVCVNNLFV